MELLLSPKSAYLLDASLEVLHEQSTDWLNEIAFWRDESAFFYSLIVKKTLKSVPLSAKSQIQKIEKELLAITGGELDKLQHEVEVHEKYLNLLMESEHYDKEIYRTKHHELSLKFSQFEKRFKSLKKDIFSLVELIDKSKN
ncbi:MAG: hypothetical protein ACXVPU_08330 [Bacteroidia bacterium]